MFHENVELDERTAVLITFANCTGTLAANFAQVELQQHKDRIEAICNGDLLTTVATQKAIAAVRAAQTAAIIASSAAITAATAANG